MVENSITAFGSSAHSLRAADGVGEEGKTSTFFSALVLFASVAYLKIGRQLLLQSHPEIFDILVLVSLGLAGVFSVGCMLHMLLIGEPSLKAFRNLVISEADHLCDMTDRSLLQLAKFENRRKEAQGGVLTPTAIQLLDVSRQVTAAMQSRANFVDELICKSTAHSVTKAHELLHAPLHVENNSSTSLITTDPIPPLEADQLVGYLSRWFGHIDSELSKMEAVAARKKNMAAMPISHWDTARPQIAYSA